jgi:hypothetical protein
VSIKILMGIQRLNLILPLYPGLQRAPFEAKVDFIIHIPPDVSGVILDLSQRVPTFRNIARNSAKLGEAVIIITCASKITHLKAFNSDSRIYLPPYVSVTKAGL